MGNLNRMIDQVAKEKGIARETLVEALEAALVSAARKKYGNRVELEAQFSEDSGEVEVFLFKDVVEDVEDATVQIDLATARRELDPEAEVGDQLGVKMETESFGRIAAQTAKQVIIQKVKDAERENLYAEYKDRKGDVVTGMVQRFEKRNIIVNLGRGEAILPFGEQIPRESYRQGDRIRALILDVRRTQKDPQIILSRAHPAFLVKLFEQEVPEIAEGIVRIMCAAREPSQRAKIGVRSTDADVDPVGACVGMKGSRVQAVVQELRGEKIDIIPWSDDPAHFVCNALQPAEISKVIIDQDVNTMEVIVADDQLSLAIGKKGQNVRLAAKLTGWKIDVRSESKDEKITGESFERLLAVEGMDEETATILFDNGYRNPEEIARATLAELTSFMGITEEKGSLLMRGALRYLAQQAAGEMGQMELDEGVEEGLEEGVEEATEEAVDEEHEEDAPEPEAVQSAAGAGEQRNRGASLGAIRLGNRSPQARCMNRGHVPIRTCIGCRKRRPAREMIRFTSSGDTLVVTSRTNQQKGRGCYSCPNEACVKAALKKGSFARALRKSTLVLPSQESLLRGLEQKGLLDDHVDR